MNCVNCGAAMALNPRGYYVCAHCGTTSFPEAISRYGIRILGPGDTNVRCSCCNTTFVRGMLDEYQVDYCENCRGLLLARRHGTRSNVGQHRAIGCGLAAVFRYGIAAAPSTREAASNAALYFACLAGSNGCQSVAPLASSHSPGYSSKIWILLASAYCSRFEMSIWP